MSQHREEQRRDRNQRAPEPWRGQSAKESSSAANTESWAASWRSSSPRDMRKGGGAEFQREGAEKALRAKGKRDGRCNEQRDARAQPLGHQGGEPPWAAVASAQSRRGNQEHRGRRTGTATHQKTKGQTRETADEEPSTRRGPPAGARRPDPGWPEDLPRASKCEFAVHCVSRSPV